MSKSSVVAVLMCLLPFTGVGQQNRLKDFNQIGWFVYNGDHKLSKKWELHTEYQWRRVNWVTAWQQSLARVGTVYSLNDKVKFGFGYTNLITYPYGDYPTAETGVPYPEHRLYEDIQIADTIGVIQLSHRFRLEQRWISEMAPDGSHRIIDWDYQHRIRYQIEAVVPLQGRTIENNEFYLSFFDELFISFGKNVGYNTFNQNRISGGLGYQVRDNLKLELGYLYQVTQHPEADPITNSRVFEYNTGFRLNVAYDLDFTR
ncbi:DUF2490 domain-containing protein [Spirosoma soli]|uniref:DUF2490 domain-containing protein n=1 Tax=Spirosoma soli TaxID=1770529 RepID=A0ABW5M3G0_9BACT